jgi:thioredoxin 2
MLITCPNCGAKNRVDHQRARSDRPVCGKCGTPLPVGAMPSSAPIEVTDATFAKRVLEASRPVLVDCWAPWCGPCRMVAPTIDALAAEAEGRYLVAKLNTDENQEIATRFKIDAIPTLLIFNRGQLIDRLVGLQPKQAIAARLERIAG